MNTQMIGLLFLFILASCNGSSSGRKESSADEYRGPSIQNTKLETGHCTNLVLRDAERVRKADQPEYILEACRIFVSRHPNMQNCSVLPSSGQSYNLELINDVLYTEDYHSLCEPYIKSNGLAVSWNRRTPRRVIESCEPSFEADFQLIERWGSRSGKCESVIERYRRNYACISDSQVVRQMARVWEMCRNSSNP